VLVVDGRRRHGEGEPAGRAATLSGSADLFDPLFFFNFVLIEPALCFLGGAAEARTNACRWPGENIQHHSKNMFKTMFSVCPKKHVVSGPIKHGRAIKSQKKISQCAWRAENDVGNLFMVVGSIVVVVSSHVVENFCQCQSFFGPQKVHFGVNLRD
jgi:hypothetical protein